MVRFLNNMRQITAHKKLNAKEQLNSISVLQILFDELKKETGLLTSTMSTHIAFEAPQAALSVRHKI